MDENTVSLITSIITPLGLIAVAAINYWTSIRASKDAAMAQKSASEAAQQAALATMQQITSNKDTHAKLTEINDTTHLVHTIVNSQHTQLLQLVANLTKRVATDNPHDLQAQEDAKVAAAGINQQLRGTQVGDVDLTKP